MTRPKSSSATQIERSHSISRGRGDRLRKTCATVSQVAGSKIGIIAKLIKRSSGASIDDLMRATGWQSHSVRGAISGVLRKKRGLSITLGTRANGTHVYRIGA